jgi:hypothetical protein
MRRTPALAHRAWKLRLKLRGSIGVAQAGGEHQAEVVPGRASRLWGLVVFLAAELERRQADVGQRQDAR